MRQVSVLVMLVFLMSCAGTVKYSPAELNVFTPNERKHIKKGEVSLGMSPIAVRFAWGSPNLVRVLRPDEQGRDREEWIYKKMGFMITKLIFSGQELTGMTTGYRKRKSLFKRDKAQNKAVSKQPKQEK